MENRTIEQVINEGNAIIKAKDNEIKNIEWIKGENIRLREWVDKLYERQYHFDKTLRRQYVEKNDLKEKFKKISDENYEIILNYNKKISELRSNAHTYIKKISHQHNEIERQKKEITNVLNVLQQVQEERNELQNRFSTVKTIIFLLSGALLCCLISSVIIINELI